MIILFENILTILNRLEGNRDQLGISTNFLCHRNYLEKESIDNGEILSHEITSPVISNS